MVLKTKRFWWEHNKNLVGEFYGAPEYLWGISGIKFNATNFIISAITIALPTSMPYYPAPIIRFFMW